MTSSEERREVAERLSVFARETNGTSDFSMYLGHWVNADEEQVGNPFTVQANRKSAERTLEKLADLIDSTCSMDAIDTGEMADYDCSEHIMHCKNCDAEFGYVLYSEDGDVIMDDKPKFCPNCGAMVVGE